MFVKSKINIINKDIPELVTQIYQQNGKGVWNWVKIKEPNFVCKVGEELRVISKCIYVDQQKGNCSYFYGVINEINKTFYLDEHEINFEKANKDLIEIGKIPYGNSTPIFYEKEKQQKEVSPLD